MPIINSGGTVLESAPLNFDQFFRTGVIRADQFALRDRFDQLKQLQFLIGAAQAAQTTYGLQTPATTGDVTITFPSTSGGLTTHAFGVIQTPTGTSPTAGTAFDTLNLTSSDSSVSITGNSSTNTVDFKSTGGGGAFLPLAGGTMVGGASIQWADTGATPAISTDGAGNLQFSSNDFSVDSGGNITTQGGLNLQPGRSVYWADGASIANYPFTGEMLVSSASGQPLWLNGNPYGPSVGPVNTKYTVLDDGTGQMYLGGQIWMPSSQPVRWNDGPQINSDGSGDFQVSGPSGLTLFSNNQIVMGQAAYTATLTLNTSTLTVGTAFSTLDDGAGNMTLGANLNILGGQSIDSLGLSYINGDWIFGNAGGVSFSGGAPTFLGGILMSASNIAFDSSSFIIDHLNSTSIQPDARILVDSSSNQSANWDGRTLSDSSSIKSVDWANRKLYDTTGSNILLDWSGNGVFSKPAITYHSGNYTIQDGDYIVMEQAGSSTVTLQTAVGRANQMKVIKNWHGSGGPITLAAPSGQLEGSTTISMGLNKSYTVVSDGTQWNIIGTY